MPENNTHDIDTTTIPGERRVDVIGDLIKLTAGGESLFFPRHEVGALAVNLYGLALAQIGTELGDTGDTAHALEMITAATTRSIVEWRGALGLPTTD